jgi:nucleotide-binding universal stress UspA family protein/ribosomal protein S21
MKKILVVFDGAHFSGGALEFSRVMNELQPLLLTGVFLPQADYAGLFNYGDAITTPLYIPVIDANEKIIEKNIRRFKALCEKQGIEYRVHEDNFDFALPELKKETRFADLLIIGSESFYNYIAIREPNEYVQETLHSSECPVLVVPERFTFPVHNILCYDGSESSVYAIKQFAYLFPELTKNPSLLIYAGKEGDIKIPDDTKMEELVARHFPNLSITSLEMEPRKKIREWLAEKDGSIVVSGSYGRSLLSRLFKKSFASGIISDHRLPVFIAHK